MSILDKINLPQDLKSLSLNELEELCEDIDKIGKRNFKFEIIQEYETKRGLHYYEQYYQARYRCIPSFCSRTAPADAQLTHPLAVCVAHLSSQRRRTTPTTMTTTTHHTTPGFTRTRLWTRSWQSEPAGASTRASKGV